MITGQAVGDRSESKNQIILSYQKDCIIDEENLINGFKWMPLPTSLDDGALKSHKSL